MRIEAQNALIPLAIAKKAELLEEFAGERFALGRHRNVVRSPREFGDFVFTRTRVAAGLALHFEQHEIAKAPLVEMPCGAEPGHAPTDDHDRDAELSRRRTKGRVIAKAMSEWK